MNYETTFVGSNCFNFLHNIECQALMRKNIDQNIGPNVHVQIVLKLAYTIQQRNNLVVKSIFMHTPECLCKVLVLHIFVYQYPLVATQTTTLEFYQVAMPHT